MIVGRIQSILMPSVALRLCVEVVLNKAVNNISMHAGKDRKGNILKKKLKAQRQFGKTNGFTPLDSYFPK